MNRCKTSAGILAGLILLCIFSLLELKTQSQNYLAVIDELQDTLETGTTEQALQVYDKLEHHLESYHNITGLFVNGTELDEIRKTIAGLQPMIATNHQDTQTEIAKLRMLIQSIYDEELPELWHIL